MQAILFCGIPGSGKSTFYKERFFRTHLRISTDLLSTRNKEARLLQTCLETQQRFVVDNTNPTVADRARYIRLAKGATFAVTGPYFQRRLEEALTRNRGRTGKKKSRTPACTGKGKPIPAPIRLWGWRCRCCAASSLRT